MMDLGQLRSFAEVAERGTVAAAAAARGYTAPAVSQHLGKLEAELDAPLFDRVGRRLHLTDAGAALLPVALQMIDLEMQARAVVDADDAKPGVVVAGLASALAAIVIPQLVELNAQARLEVIEMEDADALRELRLTGSDVALVQEYEGQPVDRDRRLTFTAVAVDKLRLALPPNMPRSTTLDELGQTSWLLNGSGTRCEYATMAILAEAGIKPLIAGSVADNDVLLSLVAAGHGVTIVPELMVGASRQRVTLADQDLGMSRTIHAVTRTVAHRALAPTIDILRNRAPLSHTG